MSVLLRKILWRQIKDRFTDEIGDNIYEDPILIQVPLSTDSVKALDIKNNILTLRLANTIESSDSSDNLKYKWTDSEGKIVFSEQDKISIWAGYTDDGADIGSTEWGTSITDTPDDATYLLGNFYVIEFRLTDNEKGRFIELKCADKNYIVFNKVFANSYKSSDGWTAPKIIQDILKQTSQGTSGEKTGVGSSAGVKYDIDARLNSQRTAGEISNNEDLIIDTRRTTRQDGTTNPDTNFPDIDIALRWRPVFEWINELSQIDQLNNSSERAGSTALTYGRPFIFWLDENQKFHWVFPTNDIDSTITIGTTTGVLKVDMKKNVFDAVNMIVFNAGSDMYNTGIWGYHYDPSSALKSIKISYRPMTDIALELIDTDYSTNTTREGTPAGKPRPQFTTDGSYPLATTSWSDDSGIANDGDYNDSLRTEAKRRATIRAKSITTGRGKPKWKGTISLKGQIFRPGALINFTDIGLGMNQELIRIKSVRHNITKSQWVTVLQLEEDSEFIEKFG